MPSLAGSRRSKSNREARCGRSEQVCETDARAEPARPLNGAAKSAPCSFPASSRSSARRRRVRPPLGKRWPSALGAMSCPQTRCRPIGACRFSPRSRTDRRSSSASGRCPTKARSRSTPTSLTRRSTRCLKRGARRSSQVGPVCTSAPRSSSSGSRRRRRQSCERATSASTTGSARSARTPCSWSAIRMPPLTSTRTIVVASCVR